MVQGHHGAHRVEAADRGHVFDLLPDQAGPRRRLRVDSDGIEAAGRQPVDEAAVTAADLEHSRPRGQSTEDDRVEAAPPTIAAHV
jgi:hypothetical protein